MTDAQKKGLLKKLETMAEKRSDFLATAQEGFNSEAKKAQEWLHEKFFSELIDTVEIKDGKFVTNTANLRKVAGSKVFTDYYKTWGQKFLDYIVEAINTIIETAGEWIRTVTGKPAKVKPEIILAQIGIKDGALIRGSYLETMLLDTGPERLIKQAAVKAIASGQSLKDFRASYSELVKGGQLSGVVESQFQRAGFDAFAEFDRALNNQTAVENDLNFAIFNGSLMRTSRSFCIARAGKVFSREEVLSWNKLDWQGKNKNSNVLYSLGGFRCNHILSWVTAELAGLLKNE